MLLVFVKIIDGGCAGDVIFVINLRVVVLGPMVVLHLHS